MTEALGIPVTNFSENGELIVTIGNRQDDDRRPYVRAESRDVHDNTYFTLRGDEWGIDEGSVIGAGDGETKIFKLPKQEVRQVQILVNGSPLIEGTDYSVDYTTYDSDYNEIVHFCTGTVTMTVAPADGAVIAAGYAYAAIGCGKCVFEWDFSKDEPDNSSSSSSQTPETNDPDTITKEISFCDPVHIKDGTLVFSDGKLDSTADMYVVCPAGYYYKDNAGGLHMASEDLVVEHYVIDQRMLGWANMGITFDVESRSKPLFPGYKIRLVVKRGSATILRGYARLEINRQRTIIMMPQD